MKRKALLLTICTTTLTVLIIISCKKDKDQNISIVGSWEADKVLHSIKNINTFPPTVIYDSNMAFKPGQGYYMEYHADYSYLERLNPTASNVSDSGTYALLDDGSKIVKISSVFPLLSKDTNDIAFPFKGTTMIISYNDTIAGIQEIYSAHYLRR